MLPNNQWVNEQIKEAIKNYMVTNENGNTTFKNLYNTSKTVLRGKFTAIKVLPQEIRTISNK